MVCQAVRREWPTSAESRQRIVNDVGAVLERSDLPLRHKLAAARCVVEMTYANLRGL
jgi:hypothetical protein